ncbi:hypothetical protein BGX24_001471 [Mortierella sp. AD032]|nr:hypothetical protein BGX24_001471 [Mortierella sp. AD032]
MTGILDLPEEIRPLIGQFLHTNAIKACLLVNHSFRRSFEPVLWQKVVIRPPLSPVVTRKNLTLVDIAALRARTLDVHNYVIHYDADSEFYKLSFPNLRRLQLIDNSNEVLHRENRTEPVVPLTKHRQDQMLLQTQLAQLNPTVSTLIIKSLPAAPSAEFWTAIHSQWVNPRILRATGPVAATEEASNAFWKACTHFADLSLIHINVAPAPLLSTLAFPRVQFLNIRTSSKVATRWFQPKDQLIVMMACPQLRHLILAGVSTFQPLADFQRAIELNHWPNLDTLDLERVYNKLGRIFFELLRALPALTTLRLEYCQLTNSGFQQLKERQFESLRTLKISAGCGFTSEMALEVLASCVNLEDFRSTHIYAQDLDPHTPWVCKRLRSLTICILHRESTPNRTKLEWQVYAQLAQLTNLIRLDLSQRPMGYTPSDPEFHLMDALNTLDIRLKAGLGQLSTLSKLQFFGFAYSFQLNSEIEILWMLAHWKDLETVIGMLGAGTSAARKAMSDRGVHYQVSESRT